MKIPSVDRNIGRKYKAPVIKTSGDKGFSNTLDMAKRDQQKLDEMVKKIKTSGDKLKRTQSKADVIEYKKYIREYLSFVLENYYRVKQDYGLGRLLLRVEAINKKIEELTNALLEQQKASIAIVSKIDEITGLLVDLYH
ncbi:MAG: hypothetical protein A4E55_00588 [Pelotomaculum sp. PtaU1.Bin035]|nr:MAG: hypothetical protein A4E55_00588 [Pelotomaculum sp. PtaU1.Bin035]